MLITADRLYNRGRAITVAAVIFALGSSAAALPTRTLAASAVAIGTNNEHLSAQASVAVDPSGTAYIAWPNQGGTAMNFCKLAQGASSCSTQQLSLPSGTTVSNTNPTVLLEGEHVYVFAEAGSNNSHEDGMVGFVSTNGGGAFSQLLGGDAISWAGGDSQATLDPVLALPGGNVGIGYVTPTENPTFQAVSLTTPAEDSAGNHPTPAASLNPSPDSYQIGNLGGQLAAQLSGSEGVLGVFELIETGGCPTSNGLAYAFAPLPATNGALDTSTGSGSAWDPLQTLECSGDYPAVAGGPAGLGVLDEDETTSTVVYRPFSAAAKTFGAPVTVAVGHEISPSLSQDGSGGVYASWIAGGDELELAYSSSAGTSWHAPVALVNSGTNGIGGATSAVDTTGHGWAVYTTGGTEYALPFTAATVTSPGATGTAISQTTTIEGEHTTLSVPAQCVSNGIVKGDLTVKIPSHKRKGKVVVKIYKVIFSVGATHKTITRKKLSNAPFVAVLHVKGLTPGQKYELTARAFIAVHHGPPRSKTLHVTITTCA